VDPSLDLWSRASRDTPISTLVPAPGSESMRKFPPSISAPSLMYRRPITLGQSLLCRVERERAVELRVGPTYPVTIGDGPRLVMEEEVRACEPSR
jgi:hypothetical protein